ncbi:MAG TPA: DUF2905 domain-containing protein [Deltaproteobacteria bacterium]|nr:DUF2905 domain-containing protein [Deltaproteobacteria bacterium]HPR54357.1 DUF2905 domain-containing protein [Deltaproteobacteria bacterium]HXK47004.1 DUF2905 domain-containing protein [Deltaproteobacteria bacterium]
MRYLGSPFIAAGIVLLALGIFFTLGGSLSWLGRLPGDLRIERTGFTFFFPLTTSILVSIVITLVMYLIRLFR